MAVSVRLRLFKWAVWGVVIFVAVFGVLFAPAIYADLTARNGTFQATKRKFERLRSFALWRSPEQKRILNTLDGKPPKPPAPPTRTYYVPNH
ncbi:MAG TPA: hypothetical protein VKQ32_18525 [Polyangia bacterium]|nr:hypothetical protein [Polyangia bacterium]